MGSELLGEVAALDNAPGAIVCTLLAVTVSVCSGVGVSLKHLSVFASCLCRFNNMGT